MPETTPDQYAGTVVTLISLGALALGTLAMFVRFLARRWHTFGSAGRQLVADVKRGEGFTFHRTLLAPEPPQRANGQPPRRLRLREWLDLVNHRPDQVPHLFIEGGSGTGKTTLATAILHDRPGPIAVVGVKPDDGWGEGYVYRSEARPAFLTALLAEVRRRLDAGDRSGLTLVLDDFTRLASDHAAAVALYKLVADVGRSLRIRLILIARGRQVKGIGAQGESDLLEHFVFLRLARDHTATLEYDEETYPLETAPVKALARPLPAARWWQPTAQEAASTSPHTPYLLSLLAEDTGTPVSGIVSDPRGQGGSIRDTRLPGIAGTPHSDAIPAEGEAGEGTGGIPATLTLEAIQTLYNAGWSKNKISALLTGRKQKRLDIIDAALTEHASVEETANASR